MKRFRNSLSLLLAFTIAFTMGGAPKSVFGAESQVTLTVLATSDLHGKLYPWEYATDSAQEYGLAKIATLIKQERAKDADAIVVDNGDLIESNMINLFNEDPEHPMVKAINMLKYDTWTMGNHEFNFGLDVLGRAISTFKGAALSANITKTDGSEFTKPYIIKNVKGVKVAILGLTTPFIPRWEASAPEHFAGLAFADPLATAQKYVDILKNQEKVDVIVGTFHIGRESEKYDPAMTDSVRQIGETVKGIDAIIAGHEHGTFGQAATQVFYGDAISLEPSSNGMFLGKLNITLTKTATGYKVTGKSTDLITAAKVVPDQEILDAFKYVDERSKENAYAVIGKASADFLPAEPIKGIPVAQIQDTAVVDIINKVQTFYTNADVSAAALFDVRSNLKAGELQFKDAALIYKYSNTLQAHKISGKNLKAYMEWSASYYNTQQKGDVTISFDEKIRAYNYDMFSGVTYKVDITKPAGQRIVDLTFKGQPLADDQELVLAVNNYRVGTLQSLGLLPNDNSSLVYDSVLTPTPEMQRLITKYISEEMKGVVDPVVDNNWSVKKEDYSTLEGAKEAIELVNKGYLAIPASADGRTPNVKAINVLEPADANEYNTLRAAAKIAIPAKSSEGLTKGQVYKAFAAAIAKAPATTKINVISFNDFHGTLAESSSNTGAPKFVQAVKDKVASYANPIVVSAGDNYNGSALSNIVFGKPVSELLKSVGIIASAVGNHEFDWGIDKFATWSEDMGAPFLAANIYERATDKPAPFAIPYLIKEVAGVKVGFLGLTTQETAFKSIAKNVDPYEFKDPVETAKKYVPMMKAEGADVVILLTHIGTEQDSKTKEIKFEAGAQGLVNIPNVDAIITAHSHKTVVGEVNGVPVVQAYYNGRTLAELAIYVDKTTHKAIMVTPSLDEVSKRKDKVAEDTAMVESLKKYSDAIKPLLEEVLGENKADLMHDRTADVSALGQWVTEVMMKAANADIAVTNAGGIRTNLMAGKVTMGNMYDIMPFDNVNSVFEMTGAQIKEIFEHGIENKEVGGVQFSGLRVEYIKGAEKGSKVVKMVLDNGTPIEADKVYKVVTNDFMATGGDNYSVFKQAKYLGDGAAVRDIMAAAVKEAGVLDFKAKARLVPSTGKPSPAISPAVVLTGKEYVVKEGDVLWKIAEGMKVKYQDLAKYNKLGDANLIYPGQKLYAPAS